MYRAIYALHLLGTKAWTHQPCMALKLSAAWTGLKESLSNRRHSFSAREYLNLWIRQCQISRCPHCPWWYNTCASLCHHLYKWGQVEVQWQRLISLAWKHLPCRSAHDCDRSIRNGQDLRAYWKRDRVLQIGAAICIQSSRENSNVHEQVCLLHLFWQKDSFWTPQNLVESIILLYLVQ